MYCPKCKDSFEEGSRRFCPTDGSRLIPEAAGSKVRQPGGIFANLIPKIEAISDLDETLPRENRAAAPIPGPDIPLFTDRSTSTNTPFFELDDPDLELDEPIKQPPMPRMIANEEPSETETRPMIRKVQPFEIPAGHVDLGGVNRFPSPAADFDIHTPERFVGRTVKGRYAVTEYLGGDETGLAYLGDDKLVEDRKVLVRILIEDDYDEIMSSILAEERVSLSHFSHPNIARLIDSGEFANGWNFLVSEFVDALSVNDILTIHGTFDPQRAGRVIRQAAGALNEAHQEGIIHRDIRPENLIIDALGEIEQVKVVNFGASNGDPNEHNLGYKAPEVLDGRIATVASDIFSLGVVAYEMLTGGLPFAGVTEKELLREQNAGNLRLPSHVRPGLARSVDEVFEKALAANAAERFPKARDLGDALYTALMQAAPPVAVPAVPIAASIADSTNKIDIPSETPAESPVAFPAFSEERLEPAKKNTVITLEPAAAPITAPPVAAPAVPQKDEANWRNRSPEPPDTGSSWKTAAAIVSALVLLSVFVTAWYFTKDNPAPAAPEVVANTVNSNAISSNTNTTEMPPLPRSIVQPPDTNFYQNNKQDLKGDLLRNFVGFTMYYPKDWKVNGPQSGTSSNSRGKFLDIAQLTPDGRMKEQMLISYYPSKGTFGDDADKFPQLVKETNETLKKILPGYQMVSEGPTILNGNWRGYEIKFQGGGTSPSGEKMVVWGRRLFVPASRPGARNGFEITMLATSLAETVTSVDDIGVKGKLASVLDTFEPAQNF